MARRPKGAGKARSADRPSVVRRPRSERRKLPPEIDDLASGRTDRLPPRKRRPRLADPRAVALIPGVANRDARRAFDSRAEALARALAERGEDPAAEERLREGLAEAILLGLWRGKSLTSFDAFAEDVLGLEAAEARRLAEQGARALETACEPLSDEAVAAWLRAEIALAETDVPGRVRARPTPEGGETLQLELDAARAPEALDSIGRRLGPLARDRHGGKPPKR